MFKEFFEIVFAKLYSLLESFIIQHKSFDDIFFQGFGSPYAELGCLAGVYTAAYRYNYIEDIVFNGFIGMSKVHFLHIAFFILGLIKNHYGQIGSVFATAFKYSSTVKT